ncbi:DUF4395 domain-containing protein [Epilithonimonas ginsengisoli]|uniref:DUF4395 domain-containing protein n=1 Tax=Epilithonimonas ginsengisoli TaxID=1245592 RepID=A0ABU4JGF0_9FLAO|nr:MULTISPECIES: DUF4395 domain-containing protein [Chryseobacterium group]MBV6880202.1 DUF4395 domain-containing protein [Epilithonimonas sp. FP105]MDW8548770.1 DUF4395 domain-containing protein [Epilithonimonas ginsengisoli]OAH76152.1 hypothetical protein AXA65_01295 [Chryseobacterium sp. FP211-J200]
MDQSNKFYTDENTVRSTAFFVVIVLAVALFFKWPYLVLLLVFDFIMRALGLSISPLALFSKSISKIFGWKAKPIFAAPKRFAATLGSLFTLLVFLLMLNGYYDSAFAVGFLLIILASLESFFKVCVGCYLYQFIVIPIQNKFK